MVVGEGSGLAPAQLSMYYQVRHLRPELDAVNLPKRELLRLCRAIEDEIVAHARGAVVLGAFQRGRFFEASRARWQAIAEVSGSAFVFADFDDVRTERGLVELPLPAGAAMLREWCVVCDAADLQVVMSARELPMRPDIADADRLFQTVVSTDRAVVRAAARVGTDLAAAAGFPEPRTVLVTQPDRRVPRASHPHLTPALARVEELRARA